MRRARSTGAVTAAALLLGACGSDPPPPPPQKPKPAATAPRPAAAQGSAPTVGTPLAEGQQKLLDEARKRQLSNDDFVEGENNRDPFRSYLTTFAAQAPAVSRQHKIILEKFSLDELKLVAIVGGDGVAPRAMFVDPSGMGVVVLRGDHVSKADAMVTRIAPDRVMFSIEEDAGGGKRIAHERVIELHAGEAVGQ